MRTRISHRGRCIGPRNSRSSFCDKGLIDSGAASDADRVYLQLEFEGFDGRRVVAAFDGGAVTSDAGAVLLRETDRAIGLIGRVAACFSDGRDPGQLSTRCRHWSASASSPLRWGTRTSTTTTGYASIRCWPLFGDSLEAEAQGLCAAGGQEHDEPAGTCPRRGGDRYHKIGHDPKALAAVLVDVFLDAHPAAPKQIIVDLDATDDPLHGHQRPVLPRLLRLLVLSAALRVLRRQLLAAKLRRSNIDAAAGATPIRPATAGAAAGE